MKFDDNELYNVTCSINGERHSLYDLADWKNGIAFKKNDYSNSSGIPIIKIAELKNGISATTSFTIGKFSEKVHLHYGDLLFSWSGNPQTSIDIFRFQFDEGWLNQHIFKVIPNDNLVDFDYFYFLMKYLKSYFKQIATNKQTTGLGHVTLADIKRMSVIVPPLYIQKQIVSLIKPIDDRISKNNEINKNLEAQLSLLYHNFFDNETELCDLGTVISTTSGGTPSRKNAEYYESSDICWVKSKELLGTYIIDTEEHINELAICNSSAKLMPKHTVLLAMYGATVGAYGVISSQMTCNQAVCGLLENNKYPYTYLFQFAKESQQQLIKQAVGSAQQNISQVLIKQMQIHSNFDKIANFHECAIPIHHKIETMQRENVFLQNIRDTLLPKLMSGELDVSDLEI